MFNRRNRRRDGGRMAFIMTPEDAEAMRLAVFEHNFENPDDDMEVEARISGRTSVSSSDRVSINSSQSQESEYVIVDDDVEDVLNNVPEADFDRAWSESSVSTAILSTRSSQSSISDADADDAIPLVYRHDMEITPRLYGQEFRDDSNQEGPETPRPVM